LHKTRALHPAAYFTISCNTTNLSKRTNININIRLMYNIQI